MITSAAAVAAARAIEEVFGIRVGIKWVNDLYIGERKVCGILTEATIDLENRSVDAAVLGVGINITMPREGYPAAIRDVAAPLTEKTDGSDSQRCRVIASTLDNFWGFYENLAEREFLDEYRTRSIVIGHDICVIRGDERKPAFALAIDDECKLVVRYENGETATLGTGEVSVRTAKKQ
jgi:BirA family biotin operon repressor/biotin-[acetyl-CoA-carboxylase] ligase